MKFDKVLVVSEAHDQMPLAKVVHECFEVSWNRAREWIVSGKIYVNDLRAAKVVRLVSTGDRIGLWMSAHDRAGAFTLSKEHIVHLDEHIIVVKKPPGMNTIPFEKGERGTLEDYVRRYLAKSQAGAGRPELGIVHRLDKETSGVMVFARNWHAKKSLAEQFREHTILRQYTAIVHGECHKQTIRSYLHRDRGDGIRGSIQGPNAENGQLSITHVEVLSPLEEATLVSCRLETGRTHQIRIHLSERRHPVVGEEVYIRNFKGTKIEAPRLMLHATILGLIHPHTGQEMRFEEPIPQDMHQVVKRLEITKAREVSKSESTH